MLLAAPARSQPQTYVFEPEHSFVHFEVVHFGTSTSRGRFGPLQGSVSIDRRAGTGELGVQIETARVSTGVPVFDARLRQADLLASSEHPLAYFVARQFVLEAGQPSLVRGEFTLRGVSQPLALRALRFACRVEQGSGHELCAGDFEAVLSRSDFGIDFALPFVADRVRVVVQVLARRH